MAINDALQWRIKVLRGPGSTVTWGPSLSPQLPLEVGPPLQLGGLRERLSSPSESGRSPAAKGFLVHFQPIWRHFLPTFSCSLSFVKLLFHVASDVKYHIVVISKFGHCIKSLWLGAGARRPRFIEPPVPPVSTPLMYCHERPPDAMPLLT